MLPTHLKTILESLVPQNPERTGVTVRESDNYMGVFWSKSKHIDCKFHEGGGRDLSTHYVIISARVHGTESNDIVRSLGPRAPGRTAAKCFKFETNYGTRMALPPVSIEYNYEMDFTHIVFRVHDTHVNGEAVQLLEDLSDIVDHSTR